MACDLAPEQLQFTLILMHIGFSAFVDGFSAFVDGLHVYSIHT